MTSFECLNSRRSDSSITYYIVKVKSLRTNCEVVKPIKFSSDCKIDASAPIHQIVDRTKKGSLDGNFVDDISSFFRLMNFCLRSVP